MKNKLFLIFVLVLGLFFRTYRLSEHYSFDIDQDIYSLIVKDIVVDKHIRLIGQLTSVEGIFVGPLYYYLLIPFYLLFNMDPIAANIPAVLIGLLTILSVYYVFSEFFGKKTAGFGSFLYAISLPIVFLDRWVVPTQLILLWSIWYLYLLFSVMEGKNSRLPLLALLIGLIWHINLGLAPLLLLVIPAFYFSGKKLPLNNLIKLGFLIIIFSLPFIFFELRHGFIQTKALFFLQKNNSGSVNWRESFNQAIGGSSLMIVNPFFDQIKFHYLMPYIFLSAMLVNIKRKKLVKYKFLVLVVLWYLLIVISQFFSGRSLSQYYFNSLIILSLLVFSIIVKHFFNKQPKLVVLILTLFAVVNLYLLITKPVDPFGYLAKKQVVEFIKNDSEEYNLPCIGISFIADRGLDVGFRYFFWWKDLNVVYAGQEIPTYTITIAPDGNLKEVDKKFDYIGLNLPKNYNLINSDYCNYSSSLLDPLWGVTF